MAQRALARVKTFEQPGEAHDQSKVTTARRLAVRVLIALGDLEGAADMAGAISDEQVWGLRNQAGAYGQVVTELLARDDR